jgi:hypothetical protein
VKKTKAPSEEARNRTALRSCRQILKTVRTVRVRHKETVRNDNNGDLIDGLLDKAVKTTQAVLLLANREYAEDAFILARSLASLSIDVAYLSANDDERFKSYRATGREARRRTAEQSGFNPPDADATDWADVKKRARRWQQGGAIKERAAKANLLSLYNYAYRHGSSFEHSDAWSLMTYDRENEWSRGVIMHLALLVTAYSLAYALKSWADFFGVRDADAVAAVNRDFLVAFPAK